MFQKLSRSLLRQMPKTHRDWLIRPYRLGQHMAMACNQYRFEYVNSKWSVIDAAHAQLLHTSDQDVWVRNIAHTDGGITLVDGYSIIPKSTFEAFSETFKNLGDRPIGDAFLYDDEVERSEFFYEFDGEYWRRASIFTLKKPGASGELKCYPLLIIESFRDHLPQYISNWGKKEGVSKISAYTQLMRLNKPKPILLSLWPAYWGLWLASNGTPSLKLFLIFTLGTILMRSCGCVLNDLADRNFDGFVNRTRMRPIATGLVSVAEAVGLSLLLALLAFGLVLFTNALTLNLALIAMGLTLLYPLMKRFTHFPQVVLGIVFNFGLPMAFAAIQSQVPLIAWGWYATAVLWTVMYDTYYALADKEDDVKIGIKSTAILLGNSAHSVLIVMQAILCVAWLCLLNDLDAGFWSYCFLCCAGVSFASINGIAAKRTSKYYIKAFIHNHWVGLWLFLAIFFLF